MGDGKAYLTKIGFPLDIVCQEEESGTNIDEYAAHILYLLDHGRSLAEIIDLCVKNTDALEYGGKHGDKLLTTIDNFLQIMRVEPSYSRIYFNLMTGRPEIHDNGVVRNWTDTDESASKHLIEQKYHIHNDGKHMDALRILFREREYNPLLNLIESFEWDGHSRCENFLIECLKADNTPYTREVSRLIFAGGINRLYSPGCKYDEVPVLVGTKQGEGKSTVVEWLALNDAYSCTTKNMSGDQKSIEALQGAWIVEIPELAAFRATDLESLKAFVTSRFDKYRLPFDRNISVLPRRCIFIGTTNNSQFLTDKTGNRRFYPVQVHSSGYDLYESAEEVKIFIQQCWAEARDRFKEGNMPPYANPILLNEYRRAQEDAMEDDWRVGLIEKFLAEKPNGYLVCVKELFRYLYPDSLSEPRQKDSREIGQILDSLFQVQKVGLEYTDRFGRQRCWKKL